MSNKKLVQISGTLIINKSVHTVFAFFANPANDHIWRTEINESRLNGPLQPGVTVSEYSYLSKKAANNLIELTCTAFERDKIAVFETPVNAPFYQKSQRKTIAISSNATEVVYENEKYYIVPQSAILMLEREEEM